MISPEQLQEIAAYLSAKPLDETLVMQLRTVYTGIHFTYCLEDDIPNHEPMLECDGFNLYLVDSREHCLCLTRNYPHASGVVIAEVISDPA
jgi:Family of unknown function (DUF6129)